MSILSQTTLCLMAVGGLLAAGVGADPKPAKPVALGVTDKEKLALRGLHHNAVEIFVDRPGFGVRRLVMNLDDLVTDTKSLAGANAKPQQAEQEEPAPKTALKPAHYAVHDLLMERAGRFPADDGKESWQLRKFHLIGLVKHAKPVVYLADKNPSQRDEEPNVEKIIPTRDVNAFEKAALAAIRAGDPLKAETSVKDMRLVAPIFAGKRCIACHEQGQLLGGFTYELERVAYDAKKDGVRLRR